MPAAQGSLARMSMPARLPLPVALSAALLLAGCGGPPARPSLSDLDGSWSGALHGTGGTCPDGVMSTLVISDTHLVFAPSGGVLQLEGHRTADSSTLHAQLVLKDMNHKPLPMVFEGHAVVEQAADGPALRIDGTYGTPTCRANVTLRRPQARAWKNLIGR